MEAVLVRGGVANSIATRMPRPMRMRVALIMISRFPDEYPRPQSGREHRSQGMISKVHLGGLAANSNWPGTCEEKTGNKVNAGPGACANQPTWHFTRLPHRRQRDGSGEQHVQMPDTRSVKGGPPANGCFWRAKRTSLRSRDEIRRWRGAPCWLPSRCYRPDPGR